jgi:DNA-binding transcriptional MocR family regulator
MPITTRRTLVRQLADGDPTLSARAIAIQVGVSKDTVLRDLDATEPVSNQPAPESAIPEPEPAPATAPQAQTGAPEHFLVLVLDESLRQALAVLRAQVGAADTEKQNRSAARAAIRAVADRITEEVQYSEGISP